MIGMIHIVSKYFRFTNSIGRLFGKEYIMLLFHIGLQHGKHCSFPTAVKTAKGK